MSRIARAGGPLPFGVTRIAEMGALHPEMLMDFFVVRLRRGETYRDAAPLEKALLLVQGAVRLEWPQGSHEQARGNCFDEPPTALHADADTPVGVTCLSEECELNVLRTDNETRFPARLYLPADTPDEFRGAGLMHETSTRIVRTIFDYTTAPYANLVLGEVIGFPGKWSSYPPHHHPQPEIYYYKLNPSGGFAYAELGEEVVKVRDSDAVFIEPGLTHPHCTPPGYALWYLWGIRHLPGAPYITPTFLPEHLWVQAPDAAYWGDDYPKDRSKGEG